MERQPSNYLGSAMINKKGAFWKMEVMPTSKLGRKVVLCFPAVRSGSGWQWLADALLTLAGEDLILNATRDFHNSRMNALIPIYIPRSFADIVRAGLLADPVRDPGREEDLGSQKKGTLHLEMEANEFRGRS